MKKQKGLSSLIGIVIIVAVAVVAVGGIFAYQYFASSDTAKVWCHTFSTNLKIGDSGEEVKALFIALQKSGYIPPIDAVGDGFDSAAASAVVQFQVKYGISQTSAVDPATRVKLNELYGCATSPTE